MWCRQTPGNRGVWGNLEFVRDQSQADWFIVINATSETIPKKEKTLIFHMEPDIPIRQQIWGLWSNPTQLGFLEENIMSHDKIHNNLEWHLSYSYDDLLVKDFSDKKPRISTIQSNKMVDPGHYLRFGFIHYINKYLDTLDVYGTIQNSSLKNYLGPLPFLQKEKGLEQYKYHFACENNKIYNYVTEKVVDGILCECLVFYWGCPNIFDILPQGSVVLLNFENFQESLLTIVQAIKEDWWSQRLPVIKQAKMKILNELAVVPRLEKILNARKDNIEIERKLNECK
jgi:hypothetical protein